MDGSPGRVPERASEVERVRTGESLLTLEQARRRLNLSRSKLYLEIAAGKLEAVKNGVRTYVREAEVDRYIYSLLRL